MEDSEVLPGMCTIRFRIDIQWFDSDMINSSDECWFIIGDVDFTEISKIMCTNQIH